MSKCPQVEIIELKERVAELEAVYRNARGLCYGYDWNKGTAARFHRDDLIRAVHAISPLPTPPTEQSDAPA